MTVPNDKDRAAGDRGGEYADEAKKSSSPPPSQKDTERESEKGKAK